MDATLKNQDTRSLPHSGQELRERLLKRRALNGGDMITTAKQLDQEHQELMGSITARGRLSEEEADAAAWAALAAVDFPQESTGGKSPRKSIRKDNAEVCKIAFRQFQNRGKREVTAAECTHFLNRAKLYNKESPKGIGDTLGNGEGGMKLIGVSTGPTTYKIPSFEKNRGWYEGNEPCIQLRIGKKQQT